MPKFIVKMIGSLLNMLARSASQGAMTSVHCAVSDDAAKTNGKYWDSCKVVAYPNKLVTNEEALENLWSESLRLLKQKGYEISQ